MKSYYSEYSLERLIDIKNVNKKELEVKKVYLAELEKKKNIKIYSTIAKLTAPFVLAFGLSSALTYYVGIGLPFHRDDVKSYYTYDITIDKNSIISSEEYIDRVINDTTTLTLYTPWRKDGDNYRRIKRTFTVKAEDNMELYHALENGDYNYLINNLDDYEEEEIVVSKIDNLQDNDYIIEGNIIVQDKDNYYVQKESKKKNINTTSLAFTLSTLVFVMWAGAKGSNYSKKIKNISTEIYRTKTSIKDLEEEIEDIDDHIKKKEKKKINA